MLADDFNVLSRGDVAARNPVILGLDAEAFGEFGSAGQAEASTDGRAVYLEQELSVLPTTQ